MADMEVRTRIAPSPTGEDIHIGNLYTALINYAVAEKNNGHFVIRIEDTDRERYVEGAEKKILSSIEAYGIKNDEGPNVGGPYAPYRQSERLEEYKKYAEELVASGNAYYCTCSRERLDEVRKQQLSEKKVPRYDRYCLTRQDEVKEKITSGEKFVIRLRIPDNKTIVVKDLIRGEIEFKSEGIDDQVLLKSDGFPTYHLGVVVDDHLMKISHIIRAEEWIPSTPKHILLYEAFGWDLPIFAHLPILRNPDKSKLSKRKNPVWASWYLQEGFLPEAVLNFLALLGWSHPEGKEIFSLSEFIEKFELKDVNPVGPIFDLVKLKWMNQQYIQDMANDELVRRLTVYYPYLQDYKALLTKLLPLIKTRMETFKDFEVIAGHFFNEPHITTRNEEEKELQKDLTSKLAQISDWNKDSIFSVFKEVMSERKVRMPVFYYLLTGAERGLPLPESVEILGKEKTIGRLS